MADVLNEDFLVKPVDLNLLLSKIGDKLALSWIHQDSSEKLKSTVELQHSDHVVDTKQQLHKKTASTADAELDPHGEVQQLEQHLSIGYIRGAKEILEICKMKHVQYTQLWLEIEQDVRLFETKRALQRLHEHIPEVKADKGNSAC